MKVSSALRTEIDEYAKAHGITRSRAAGQFLEIAREALRGREGVSAGKAEAMTPSPPLAHADTRDTANEPEGIFSSKTLLSFAS